MKKKAVFPTFELPNELCALRLLGRLDEALTMQLAVLKEYDAITQSGNFDMPVEMFTLMRGHIYEEIAEIYNAKTKIFADLTYEDLAHNEMFRSTMPERLERLKTISKL